VRLKITSAVLIIVYPLLFMESLAASIHGERFWSGVLAFFGTLIGLVLWTQMTFEDPYVDL
jgi:prolipoprotein diacylglyceryltransferase